MPAEVLEQIFVQRQGLASELVERIRESVLTAVKSHTLLIGPRGIGKTHLVSLVYHRICEMADLQEHLLIAWLSEEEWSVTSFLDFLLCIFQALQKDVEALYDLPAEEAEAEGVRLLKEFIDSPCCKEDPPQPSSLKLRLVSREKRVKVPLINHEDPPQPPLVRGENLVKVPLIKGDLGGSPGLPASHNSNNNSRTLLLIVENLDDLFAGLGKDGQKQFYDFLETTNCVILATSQCELKETQQKKSPFYGFFHPEKLEDLSAEEATQLLANIATYKENFKLASFIQTPTGRDRINAVHFLAGGNPRIYVIFSEFLASQESLDELVGAFMAMLDDLTPYYQERMKNLSPQQRKIVDILVRCGHAVTVKEIAQRGFMTHQTASSQLKKLLEMSYVRTEQFGREAFYELREPLMRFCLKAKQQRGEPIKLIVDFLRRWYTKTELQHRLELVGGEVSQAREYLLGAIQAFDDDDQDPRVVACSKELLRCYKKEDYVSALQQAEKLVAIRGNAVDWSIQGYCLGCLKRYEEAITSYDKALEIKPDYHEAWNNRGIALRKLGRYEEAIASYDKALEIKPDDHQAWYNRGYALDELGRYEEAIASYDKALEIKPDFHQAWYNRGYALRKLGRSEEAIASYDKALEIKPDDHQAWDNRGYALIYLGRYEEALASCEKAIELDSQYSYSLFNQAIALTALNRWDEGITTLEEAFHRFKDGETDTEDAELIIRNLFKNSQDPAIWKTHLTSLINLYDKYQAISTLGQGLVQSIPMLMSEMVSDKAAQTWLEMWQELGSNHTDFQIPLRLLDAAVGYREKSDKRVLLSLPIEERKLLQQVLGIDK
jgi:tetratricopeptide (TPR) repeat protein